MFETIREMVSGMIFAHRHRHFQKDIQAAFAAGSDGRYAETETQLAALFDRAKREIEPASSAGADVLMMVAAQSLARLALEIFEHGEPSRFGVAVILLKLAELYRARRRPELRGPLAVSAAKDAADSGAQISLEHPFVVDCLDHLGIWYQEVGRYADAGALHNHVLECRERELGPDHPKVAATLVNLAGARCSEGRYVEAERLCQRGLGILEAQLDGDQLSVAAALNVLGMIQDYQQRYAEAEAYCARCLQIRETSLGPGDPRLATALNNLARVIHLQGRYSDAVPLCERAVRFMTDALGPEHPRVGTTLENYAILLRQVGRQTEAEDVEARARAVRAKQS
jgi:tetratricopeptide (TPR) repeat protein